MANRIAVPVARRRKLPQPSRFTLQPGQWYALLLLGDEFDATSMCKVSPSPIRVEELTPLKTDHGLFRLNFFHANYPEGVQQKQYMLRTFYRGRRSILAISEEHDPPRLLYITDITFDWLRHNFPHQRFDGATPDDALNRLYPADC